MVFCEGLFNTAARGCALR